MEDEFTMGDLASQETYQPVDDVYVPQPANVPTDVSAAAKVYITDPASTDPPPTEPAAAPAAAPKKGRTFSPEVEAAIEEAAKTHNVNPSTLRAFVGIESSGRADANYNKKTQYKGLGQIGREEWNTHKPRPDADIYNARDNALATASLMAHNRRQFIKLMKREPEPHEEYLMHQQGPGFYTRGATTNLAGNLPPGARTPYNLTHGGFAEWWKGRFNRELTGTGAYPASASVAASVASRGPNSPYRMPSAPGAPAAPEPQRQSAAEASSWPIAMPKPPPPAEEQQQQEAPPVTMGSILATPPRRMQGGRMPLMPGLPMMGGVASQGDYR